MQKFASLNTSKILMLVTLLIILGSLPLAAYLAQKPQEIRTRAQFVVSCQSLIYPCSEGQISFPNDEGKHSDKQVEWWYANFNSTSTSLGVPLAGAFALVRVKQIDGTDKGYALLEITNENNQTGFFYRILTGTITAASGSQNVSFVADPGTEVNTIKFYRTGSPFQYKLEVSGTGININLTLSSNKRPLVEGGDGYVPIFPSVPTDPNYKSGYYSLTNLSAVSNDLIVLPGMQPVTASGIAWIDHQWFNSPYPSSSNPYSLKGNHEWFSIQLDNNIQIVAWNIFKDLASSTFVLKNLDVIDALGNQTHYDDVAIDPKSYWKAPGGKTLAGSWRIYKDGEFDLTIVPTIQNQYVIEAGTYEGSSDVSGKYKGEDVKGQGFAEMRLTYFNQSCDPLIEFCDAEDDDCDYRIDEFCRELPTKRVFVTDTMYSGNLGGLSGADAKCQARADAAGLGGNWKAWLSDSTTNAKDRIANAKYVRTGDGLLIANHIVDLTDGSIANPINRNPYGNLLSAGSTWTGTGSNGTVSGSNTCSNWKIGGIYGEKGYVLSNTTSWTDNGQSYCGYSRRLYCFEQ